MIAPLSTSSAFDRIGAELEFLLIRLGRSAPGAELTTIRDEITSLLDNVGLTWSDLAARITAPPPAKTRAWPTSEISTDPATPSAEVERWLDNHSGSPPPGHGQQPSAEAFVRRPGESDEEAGRRLAKWALDVEGVVYYEDPPTGELHPVGWIIPGKGKVMRDGTLDPLPAED